MYATSRNALLSRNARNWVLTQVHLLNAAPLVRTPILLLYVTRHYKLRNRVLKIVCLLLRTTRWAAIPRFGGFFSELPKTHYRFGLRTSVTQLPFSWTPRHALPPFTAFNPQHPQIGHTRKVRYLTTKRLRLGNSLYLSRQRLPVCLRHRVVFPKRTAQDERRFERCAFSGCPGRGSGTWENHHLPPPHL